MGSSQVALDFLPPPLSSGSLRCLSAAAAGGWLAPSPSVSFELGAARVALRALGQARHVGKVVVRARAPASQGLCGGSADVCLVSGGLGALGGLVGLWLSQRGSVGPGSSARLILVGRSGRHEGSSPLLSLLARGESGALVTFGRCDAGSASEAAAVLLPSESLGGRSGRLASLMHAGGVLQDATLANQTASGARAVVAPKVDSLSRLSGALGANPVASAALFSSVAALTGSPGQSNYSGANAAMDAWSHARQAGGCPSVSVQWGAWASGGMAARDKSVSDRAERSGYGLLTTQQGLSALQSALHALHALSGSRIGVRSELGASPFSWPRLLSWMRPVPDAYSEFIPAAIGAGSALAPSGPSIRPAAGVPRASFQRVEDVASELLIVLKGILGSEIGLNEPLMDAGLDSLSAVEFKNAAESRLGVSLPVTAVFDYPTLSSLAGYIHSQLGPASGAPEGAVESEVSPTAASASSAPWTSILGASGRASPGLFDGALSTDGIRCVPLGRWDAEFSLDGLDPVVFGGFMDGAENFDGGLFAVQASEAVSMDPQQRLLLHFSWDALSCAGVGSSSMASLGVYVGISSTDYARLASVHSSGLSAFTATGTAMSVAAGRLSFTYGAQVGAGVGRRSPRVDSGPRGRMLVPWVPYRNAPCLPPFTGPEHEHRHRLFVFPGGRARCPRGPAGRRGSRGPRRGRERHA